MDEMGKLGILLHERLAGAEIRTSDAPISTFSGEVSDALARTATEANLVSVVSLTM